MFCQQSLTSRKFLLEDNVDDIINMLPDNEKDKLLSFEKNFFNNYFLFLNTVWNTYEEFFQKCNGEKKEFAIKYSNSCSPLIKMLIFNNWNKDKLEFMDFAKNTYCQS